MSHPTFDFSCSKNQNGVISWRVSGCLHGILIRKNFRTREEDAAEKAVLELRALQATSGLRPAMTWLTEEQLREAESAFRRLPAEALALTQHLDYALIHYRAQLQDVPLDQAIAEYIGNKKLEFERGLLSFRQMRSIRHEPTTLSTRFPRRMIGQLSLAELVPYLERNAVALKTYNNRRGILSTFFKYAQRAEWIPTNLIEKTPHHRIRHVGDRPLH